MNPEWLGDFLPRHPALQMASIPTIYRGFQFRSRLEARWAAMFDQLNWHWNYEPFDLNGWIPDFQLEGRMLVEVKPFTFEEQWSVTIKEIDNALVKGNVLGSVLLLGTELFPPPNDGNDNGQLGWIYRRAQDGTNSYTDRARLYEVDGVFDFSEDQMAWGSNLDLIGSGYRKWYRYSPDTDDVIGRWAVACNQSQWRPRHG